MSRGNGVKCEYTYPDDHPTKAGEQCNAWATKASLEGEDGPRCYLHSKTAEQRQAHARKAAKASAAHRHGRAAPLPQSDIRTGVSLGQLYATLSEALTATNELGHPDWSARLAACAVLVLAEPNYFRQTPEEAQALLARMIPANAAIDPDRVHVQEAFRRLRAEWWSLPAYHPIRGLVARPLPRRFVLPFEDYTTVVRNEEPKDVPLEEVEHLKMPSGKVAIRHDGLWHELPEAGSDEVEHGGLLRAVSHAR